MYCLYVHVRIILYQLSDLTKVQSAWVIEGFPTVKDGKGPDTEQVTHSDTKRATPSWTYTSGWDFGSESEGACICLSVIFQDTACVYRYC